MVRVLTLTLTLTLSLSLSLSLTLILTLSLTLTLTLTLTLGAIYGGRVDNLQDERLLQIYLKQFFAKGMQERRLAPGVALPSSSMHADYVQLISTLPAQVRGRRRGRSRGRVRGRVGVG